MEPQIAKPCAGYHVHETAIELIKNGKRGKLLDLGSGEGALALKLFELGFDVKACDINPANFKVDKIHCEKVDLNKKLPFDDNSFEYVTCIEVIEHVENPWQLIREISRILKHDGILVLSTPNLHNWYSRIIYFTTTNFHYFNTEHDFTVTGHITPIFLWNFKRMIRGRFKIDIIKFNQSIIPLIRVRLPLKNLFLGDVMIMKLVKSD